MLYAAHAHASCVEVQGNAANQVGYRLWLNVTTLKEMNEGRGPIDSDADEAAADAYASMAELLDGSTLLLAITKILQDMWLV